MGTPRKPIPGVRDLAAEIRRRTGGGVGTQAQDAAVGYAEWAEKYLSIADKAGEKRRFVANRTQRLIFGLAEELEKKKGHVRMLILKPRQVGSSVACQAIMTKRSVTLSNCHALTIAHDEKTSKILFRYAHAFYSCLPDQSRPPLKTGRPSRGEINMEPPDDATPEEARAYIGGVMWIASAGAPVLGHGARLMSFHGSEVAYWSLMPGADEGEIMKGVENAVPLRGKGTCVLLESTGRGRAGLHYTMWQSARKGDSEYHPIFVPWMLHEEYELKGTGLTRPDLTDEERAIVGELIVDTRREKVFPTLENLAWRRAKLHEITGRSSQTADPGDEFRQQYPANETEAFIAEASIVFDPRVLQRWEATCAADPPARRCRFEGHWTERNLLDATGIAQILVWKEAKQRREYVIGVDPASGTKRGDFSCAQVLERYSLEQVATWHGRCDPDVLSDHLAHLGHYYNGARIAVEENNGGLMVLRRLQELGYTNLYCRQAFNHLSGGFTEKLGWWTSRSTRPLLFQDLIRALRDDTTRPRDLEFLRECSLFTLDAKGQPDSPQNEHDDRVLAYAIAIQVQRQLGPGTTPEQADEKAKERYRREFQRDFGPGRDKGFDDVLGTEW